MRVARPTPVRVSALQAFWPGQLVLHGDLARAASEFQWLMQLWRRYRALPEVFDVHTNGPVHFGKGAPLRPGSSAPSAAPLHRAQALIVPTRGLRVSSKSW